MDNYTSVFQNWEINYWNNYIKVNAVMVMKELDTVVSKIFRGSSPFLFTSQSLLTFKKNKKSFSYILTTQKYSIWINPHQKGKHNSITWYKF